MSKIKLFCLYLIIQSVAVAQVNIESQRLNSKDDGSSQQLSLNTEFLSGNSEYFGIETAYRYNFKSIIYDSFFIADYEEAHSSDSDIENKHFVHLRFIKHATEYNKEFFIQNESDEFTDLNNRFLVGTGLRRYISRKQDKRVAIGIGFMYEHENAKGEKSEDHIRSTNYLIFNKRFSSQISLESTTYYQPKVSDISDFRCLSEISLIIPLSTHWDFENSISLRYDSKPPEGIEKDDIEITQGILFSF